jgi:cardiolipin synthase (CMP-forming)
MDRELKRSIVLTIVIFLIVQNILFTGILLVYGARVLDYIAFYPITAGFHALLLGGLIALRRYFYLLPSKTPLNRINAANIITLFRVSSLPTLVYLLLLVREKPVLPFLAVFTAVVFLTDLFDGMISRKLNQTTQIGKYIDSASDYSVLGVISILFFIFELIPLWFFLLLMFRLAFQTGWIIYVFVAKDRLDSTGSFLGKVTVFATMGLYLFEILEFLNVPYLGVSKLVTVLEYAVGAALAASIFDKAFVMRKIKREDDSGTEGTEDENR